MKGKRKAIWLLSAALFLPLLNPVAASAVEQELVDDSDARITYSDSSWIVGTSAGDQTNSTEHYVNYNSANPWNDETAPYYEFTFTGTAISGYGNKAPAIGKRKIYIDNELVEEVDNTNSSRVTQQKLFEITDLTPGEHTLKVVGSTGNLQLDYLMFTPYEAPVGEAVLTIKDVDGQKAMIETSFKDLSMTAPRALSMSVAGIDPNNMTVSVKGEGAKVSTSVSGEELHVVLSAPNGFGDDLGLNIEVLKGEVPAVVVLSQITLADQAGVAVSLEDVSIGIPEKAPEINTEILETLVEKAQAELLDQYLTEGKALFEADLKDAQDVLANPETQEMVDAAAEKLHTSYLALRLKPESTLLENLGK